MAWSRAMDLCFNTYSPHMRLDEGRVVANFAAQTLHSLTSSPLIRMNSRDSAVALRKWPSASARRPPFERIWQERTVSQAVHPIAGLYWFIDDIPLRNGLAVAREHDLEVSLRASAARLFRSMRMRPNAGGSCATPACADAVCFLLASVNFAKTSIDLKSNALSAQLGPMSVRGSFL
jgi:hypothetical protein